MPLLAAGILKLIHEQMPQPRPETAIGLGRPQIARQNFAGITAQKFRRDKAPFGQPSPERPGQMRGQPGIGQQAGGFAQFGEFCGGPDAGKLQQTERGFGLFGRRRGFFIHTGGQRASLQKLGPKQIVAPAMPAATIAPAPVAKFTQKGHEPLITVQFFPLDAGVQSQGGLGCFLAQIPRGTLQGLARGQVFERALLPDVDNEFQHRAGQIGRGHEAAPPLVGQHGIATAQQQPLQRFVTSPRQLLGFVKKQLKMRRQAVVKHRLKIRRQAQVQGRQPHQHGQQAVDGADIKAAKAPQHAIQAFVGLLLAEQRRDDPTLPRTGQGVFFQLADEAFLHFRSRGIGERSGQDFRPGVGTFARPGRVMPRQVAQGQLALPVRSGQQFKKAQDQGVGLARPGRRGDLFQLPHN